MIRKSFGIFFAVFALVCLGWLIDPINRLQLRLLFNPMWVNSFWSTVRSGPETSPEKVVQAYWSRSKPVSTPRILETKSMRLLRLEKSQVWKAALVDGPEGRQILVMTYNEGQGYWSIRPQK